MSLPSGLASVAAGGAMGAMCRHILVSASLRWGVGARAESWLGALGPAVGVAAANLIGGLLIGFLGVALLRFGLAERLWPLLVTGFLGGFTTFSAFSLDALSLWEKGRADLALVYVAISVAGAILAAALGAALARALIAAP